MDARLNTEIIEEKQITVDEVNRVLEAGRILVSVLNEDEIKVIHDLLAPNKSIGNAGDS